MGNGVNKVMLLGRMGKDPEVRTYGENKKVATFSLATSEAFKNKKGEYEDKTQWHTVVMWGALAERAERVLYKGASVFIEGKVEYREYEDKDGNKRKQTDIIAGMFQLISPKKETGQNHSSSENEPSPATGTGDGVNYDINDDLPF